MERKQGQELDQDRPCCSEAGAVHSNPSTEAENRTERKRNLASGGYRWHGDSAAAVRSGPKVKTAGV